MYPSGVATLGATIDGADVLMLTSSFTVGVSHDPPMCSVAIQKSSATWPVLSRAGWIGVSVLSSAHASSVALLGSRDPRNRTSAATLTRSALGSVFLDGAAGWYECTQVREVDAGDHVIVLLQVTRGFASDSVPPLVLHRGVTHVPVEVTQR
ncbi:MAG: major facilitator superfamily 1 [Microbacterium sp.]|jgi:flavin reductase (DIM6/NTAB) family NADH-FMN oxidoreductase RutF|nr:major facilitator superfamily 1 [Microbacterium sp.]